MDHARPEYCAAIDVGSYSAKLTVARRSANGWHAVLDRVEITGLGQGEPQQRGLDPEATRRTLEVLSGFARTIDQHGVPAVAVVGTAVLRNAPDAATFVTEVRERTGLPLEVIAGDEEARLTYLGAVVALSPMTEESHQLVFDIGGASTELAWGRRSSPDDRRSLDVGTIELATRFGLADATPVDQVDAAVAFVSAQLRHLPAVSSCARLVGIGATPATLLALERGRDIADSAEVHAQELERNVIAAQIDRLRLLDTAARRELPGLHPGRAAVVLAGAVITMAVAKRWPSTPLILSGSGLRAGVMRDRFGDGR